MASAKGAEAVKVIVRQRPMNSKEKEEGRTQIVKIDSEIGQIQLINPKDMDGRSEPPKAFTFDLVYDDKSTQKQVYDDVAYPLVESVMEVRKRLLNKIPILSY